VTERRAIWMVLLATVIAAGCSSGGGSSAPSTTVAEHRSVYANGGNFTVGVTKLFLADGTPVEVWYPANGAVGVGADAYDVRTFLPEAMATRVGSRHLYVSTDANRNVLVGAPGEVFPLVVFAHGAAGFRDESTFLTTRLASWGMVVAAPEDASHDLAHALQRPAPKPGAGADLVRATIDAMQRENARKGGPFEGRIDMTKVATVGFDAGGQAAIAAADDGRVDAYVAMASAPDGSDVRLPAKPSLFLSGSRDRIVPAASVDAQFRTAAAPSYQWRLDGAGHNAFDDLCAVAKPQGGLAAALDSVGAGASLSDSLRRTLTDGCAASAPDSTKTWSAIDEAVTAFLRHFVGPDAKLLAVGPAGTRSVAGVKVTISARAS